MRRLVMVVIPGLPSAEVPPGGNVEWYQVQHTHPPPPRQHTHTHTNTHRHTHDVRNKRALYQCSPNVHDLDRHMSARTKTLHDTHTHTHTQTTRWGFQKTMTGILEGLPCALETLCVYVAQNECKLQTNRNQVRSKKDMAEAGLWLPEVDESKHVACCEGWQHTQRPNAWTYIQAHTATYNIPNNCHDLVRHVLPSAMNVSAER